MTKHVVMIVFGALVTPDGSGITMWFIVLPMVIAFEEDIILLIECVNQYSSKRSLVGDVEIKKLLHWKDKLNNLG